jgi:alkanesulfonate monooxygenase SsuD/methylene tetrahydromethanopterin reductase-like flavin-dependent oxidoreductase (luciferase family)
MATLKFGVWLPTYAWPEAGPEQAERLTAWIRGCEQHGLDIWVIDHLLTAPGLYGVAWLEPLNVLAYAAALTSTVRLATGILVLPVRHPVVLAKEIATLCRLSHERYCFGIGPGWYAQEFDVTGTRIEERGARTDEIVEAVTLLLTQPHATYRGRYYQFTDVTIDPRPQTLPEIWVSGGSRIPDPDEHDVPFMSKTVLNRIVRHGRWLSRCSGTQAWVKRDWAAIQAHARALGRDPSAITFGHCNFVHLVETRDHARAVEESRAPFLRVMGAHRSYEHLQECYMIGSPDRIRARIADLAGAGLTYLVLGPVTDDPRQLDLLVRHVVSGFAWGR